MWQGWTEPNSFHVCVTSYKQFFRGHAAFARVRWHCLVIDEMQRVKGLTERHWEAVFALQRSDPLGSVCCVLVLVCRVFGAAEVVAGAHSWDAGVVI